MAFNQFGYQQPFVPQYPQPFFNPAQAAQTPTIPPPQAAPQQSGGINWVQGEEAAKAWNVLPGCSALLMDSDASRFYLKTVDVSGMPMPLKVFEYKEVTAAPKTPNLSAQAPAGDYATRDELEALRREIEALAGKNKRKAVKGEESDE